MNQIPVYSTVKVTLGEHKGRQAVVVGNGDVGHLGHEILALVFVGQNEQAAPYFVFRLAVELEPPTGAKKPQVLAERVRRFNYNNLVTVTNRALASFGQTGRVIHVYDDPVEPDYTGRAGGVFHARYKVEFSSHAFQSGEGAVLYDWELKPAPTAAAQA